MTLIQKIRLLERYGVHFYVISALFSVLLLSRGDTGMHNDETVMHTSNPVSVRVVPEQACYLFLSESGHQQDRVLSDPGRDGVFILHSPDFCFMLHR